MERHKHGLLSALGAAVAMATAKLARRYRMTPSRRYPQTKMDAKRRRQIECGQLTEANGLVREPR